MLSLPLAVLLAASPGPRFVEDDLPQALAQAKREHKLVFVDVWAPWCHACVFMREHVLNQPDFAPFATALVFAAIDTEKTKNAAFLQRYPIDVWPTLLFLDPDGAVRLRWAGSADAAQMKALLTAARATAGATHEADALLAQGHQQEAGLRYQASLQADPSHPARATLSMLSALSLSQQHEVCATATVDALPSLHNAQDEANAVGWGLSSALELPPGPVRERVLPVLVARAQALVTTKGVLADDVSGLYETLVEARHQAKDDAGATSLAVTWLEFLERTAAAAKTPAARAVFDPHRTNAAIEAHQPGRVVPALEQSERDFPLDYNPPARLALALEAAGQLVAAQAAIDRALTRCTEGPRKLRLFRVKAKLSKAQGDLPGQRRALEAALAWAKALPAGQRSEKQVGALEAEVAATTTK
jgi:thiol-disulfide isomerase/thioredoxin